MSHERNTDITAAVISSENEGYDKPNSKRLREQSPEFLSSSAPFEAKFSRRQFSDDRESSSQNQDFSQKKEKE